MANRTDGSSQVSTVECSERVQRDPGLFEVSRSLNVAVPNCSARYIDLRTAGVKGRPSDGCQLFADLLTSC